MAGNKKQAPKKKTRPAGGYLDNKKRKSSMLDMADPYYVPDKKNK